MIAGRRQTKLARSAGESPTHVKPSRRPGSECCVSRRQRRSRSVHSGCVACVIEPRNISTVGQRPSTGLNATWPRPLCAAMATRPGSESTSRAKGSRRNFGDPGVRSGRPPWSASGTENRKPMLNERGKSNPAIVSDPQRSRWSQGLGPRAGTKGNANQRHTARRRAGKPCHRCWRDIRQTARQRKKERFTALFQHNNVELLRVAFFGVLTAARQHLDLAVPKPPAGRSASQTVV